MHVIRRNVTMQKLKKEGQTHSFSASFVNHWKLRNEEIVQKTTGVNDKRKKYKIMIVRLLS